MVPDEHYHISFFKPTTDAARRNRNMVVQLVLIWCVAIFGFQIALKLLEKPVPEPALTELTSVWASIEAGQATENDFRQAARSTLSVLGKVAISPEDRIILDRALSCFVAGIAGEESVEELKQALLEFEAVADASTDITAPAYVEARNGLIPVLGALLELESGDVRRKIAPLKVKSGFLAELDETERRAYMDAMELYLIHNRSFLTDTKFLGFPFHYFYTAVFLLILFVGLCWLYCVRTDMFHRKYGIQE